MKRLCFLLSLAAAAFAQGTSTLNCGMAGTGSLSSTFSDFYTFTAQPGDSILLRSVVSSSDPAFKPAIIVTDQQNHIVSPRVAASPNPAFTGASAAGEYDLALGGSYRIQVQNNPVTSQGNYGVSYTFLNRPCGAAPLTCGASVTSQITQIGQVASYSLAANAGDILSTRLAYGINPGPGFDITMYVYNAAAQLVAHSDTGGHPFGLINVPVSAAGYFTVVVFDPANSTGGYSVSITKIKGDCGGAALTCGALGQGNVAAPFSSASFTLTLSQGDVVSLRYAPNDPAGSLSPVSEVYDPQGNLVQTNSTDITASPGFATTTFTAAASGAYALIIEDATLANTGKFVIALLRLNRPCNSSQSPLGCSARLDGSISGHLGTSQYTVNAAAGDQYLVRLLRSGPSGAFQPRADVYDSTGKLINTAIARGLSELTFSTATAGPYTLVVSDGADGSESGAYSFSLLRLNRPCNVTATLQCGTVATGAFAQPLDSSVYSFTPAAGASFSARMIDINGVLQPGLRVYDSQGNAVGQSASGNYTGVDVVQPAAPPYTVVAVDTSATPAGGPFAVDVLQTANACGSSPPQGQTVRGVVNPAKPFLSYSVSASAGDTLLLRSASSSPGFSAQMELYDPTGARLDAATFSISRKLAAAGSYTVILESSAARTEGSYSLSWQLLNNPAAASVLPCGGSATASLVPANEFRYYTASASAGDLMRLIFTNLSTGFSPQIELFDPAGQRLAQTSDISQKASAAGNYLVVVSPSTSTTETGSFTIAYQRPNHPCSLAALTCGQTSLRQVNLAGQLDAYTFSATGGDQADLRFIQRSGAYSPFAELYDSSGNRITTTAAGIMRYTPAATATYSLLVRDSAGVNTGSYRVSLQDDTTACPVNDTQKPVITLLKPTGGEVIPGGLLYRIQWLSDDNIGVATHDVALSTDGGRTFPTALASGLSGTTQSFDWGAPATIAPSRTAVIRVTATDAAGNAQAAASGPLSLIGSGFTPNSTAAYSYDGANRLTQATLGDGRSVQYVWDAAGNLTQITVTGQ